MYSGILGHSGLRSSAIYRRVFGTGLQNSHDEAEKGELHIQPRTLLFMLWEGLRRIQQHLFVLMCHAAVVSFQETR